MEIFVFNFLTKGFSILLWACLIKEKCVVGVFCFSEQIFLFYGNLGEFVLSVITNSAAKLQNSMLVN